MIDLLSYKTHNEILRVVSLFLHSEIYIVFSIENDSCFSMFYTSLLWSWCRIIEVAGFLNAGFLKSYCTCDDLFVALNPEQWNLLTSYLYIKRSDHFVILCWILKNAHFKLAYDYFFKLKYYNIKHIIYWHNYLFRIFIVLINNIQWFFY